MVIKKRTKIIVIIIFLLISALVGLKIYNTYKNEKNTPEPKSILSSEQKEDIKYNYEIPNTFRVLDIISEEEIIVEDDKRLKVYNLKEENFTKELAKISGGYSVSSAKFFYDGVVWVVNNGKTDSISKIFIKYFSDDDVIKVDKSKSDIIPSICLTSNYLTYYIVDAENNVHIKLFDLKEKNNEVISTCKLKNGVEQTYVSTPNTDDSKVVWSEMREGKGNL